MKRISFVFGVLAISFACAESLQSHKGLYLNAGLGAGYAAYKGELGKNYKDYAMDEKGLNFQISLKAGYAFIENLAVFGDFSYDFTPTTEGQEIYSSSDDADGNVGPLFLGSGLSYWLMPVNLYVSGAVGSAKFTFGKPYTSNFGFAWKASVGKDWWLDSKGFAIGAEAVYMHASVDSGEKKWKSNSFELLFHISFS